MSKTKEGVMEMHGFDERSKDWSCELYPERTAYVVRILLETALPGFLGEMRIQGDTAYIGDVVCSFHVMGNDAYHQLVQGRMSLECVKSAVGSYDIPLALESGKAFAAIQGKKIQIQADIITLPFLLLSRAEEMLTTKRDKYGRYEYESSLACQYGLIDMPIVDEYALLLRHSLVEAYPALEIKPRKGQIVPTHDVDTIRRFFGLKDSFKTLVGDVLRYPLRVFLDSVLQWRRSWRKPECDPEVMGLRNLADISRRHGLQSTFYFMGNREMRSNFHYDVQAPYIRAVLQELEALGMTIGVHGDLGSSENSSCLGMQKSAVEVAVGHTINTGRQHFLLFRADKTPKMWAETGITCDSTLGYAEREGFRCGTCHPYPLYDFENERPLPVVEQPLIVMDGTLFSYRGMTDDKALQGIKQLYAACMRVEGNFVILWHNGMTHRENKMHFEQVYVKFMHDALDQ